MSFIKSIRRSLGINFDSDEEEKPTENIMHEEPARATKPETADDHGISECRPPCPADDNLPADMLTAVVELFNSTQPEFVSRCIDTDAQKQFLLERINADVAERIRRAIRRAHEMGLKEWEETRRKLIEEVEDLRQQKQQLEQRREESKGERLSNQRQKRAMTERINDLESKVNTLEAEKEQLLLENRSMVNRMRVAGVGGEGAVDPNVTTHLVDELEKLREENAGTEDLRLQLDAVKQQLATVTEDKQRLAEDLKSHLYTEKEYSRIRQQAEKSESALEIARKQTEQLQADLLQRDDIIRNLNDRLADALREADRLASRDANDMSHLELTEIPDIIPQPAAAASEIADQPQPVQKKKRGRRKRSEATPQPKRFSAIDELMDSTDWFDSTPPTRQEKPDKNDDDFGYKAPPKKTPPADDDKQLSLW